MKKHVLLCLLPFLSLAQVQIGNDIDGGMGEWSGFDVSLSSDGTVVAIGAPLSDENGYEAGVARVYEYKDGTWEQVGANILGEAAVDRCGNGVALSADGSIVAVGCPRNDDNGMDSGHVRIYQNMAGVWTQVGSAIEGEAASDNSGWNISLSQDGRTVAIGAPNNNGASGHVRVYQNNTGTWTQVGADIDGEAGVNWSGMSVSLSADGTIVAIGAPRNDGNGIQSGHVRVYQNNAGTWTQVGADIDGEAAGDWSGFRVSLSADGTVVAIGAIYNDGNGSESGHVRVYQNNAGVWTQVGADIDGEAADDHSGRGVSLSSDGSVVLIGANGNEENGVNSGHVRVYQNSGGTWTQVGMDIDGEGAQNNSGFSVSISADGTVGAIGAYTNGAVSGHVRVYDLFAVLSSDSFVQTNFIVYPNPTSNLVTIQLNEGLQLEKVNVYTALGQLVKTETNTILSLGELAKGSYFLEVITNQGKATKTILVE